MIILEQFGPVLYKNMLWILIRSTLSTTTYVLWRNKKHYLRIIINYFSFNKSSEYVTLFIC